MVENDSYSEDFDDGWADDWELPNTFMVEGKALSAKGPGAARYRFGDSWQNAKLTFRLKHQAGEVRIHYRVDWVRFDAGSPVAGYEFTFGAAEVTLSRFQDPQNDPNSTCVPPSCPVRIDERLGSAPLPQLPDVWREVVVSGSGSAIRLAVDGRQVLSVNDRAALRHGSIGLELRAGGLAMIDDVAVSAEIHAEQSWTRMPGPVGTQMTSIAVDPADPRRVYAGTFHSGLFVSTDRGRRWQQLGGAGGISKTKVGSIEIAPSAPNLVYLNHLEGGGGSRSDDSGLHWARIRPGNFGQVNAFAAHPQDASVVYAGIGTSDSIHSPLEDGVYVSRDRGATWQQLLKERAIFDLEIAPSRPATMYAAGPFGVMRSEDAGATWIDARSGLGEGGVVQILVDPRDPLVVYARHGIPFPGMGVYRTVDGGRQWQPAVRQAEALAISGTGSLVYAMDFGHLLRSSNRGQTWERVGDRLAGQMVPALAVDPSDDRRLYAGVRGQGVVSSADGGSTWERPETHFLGDLSVALAVHPRNKDAVYVGHGDGRLSVTADGGGSWRELTRIGPSAQDQVTSIAIAAGERDVLFASNRNGVHRSRDGGLTWTSVSPGADRSIITLALDPTDPRRVLAGTGSNRPYGTYQGSGMYLSTDGGDTWSKAGGLPSMPIPAIVFSRSRPSVVYAAALGGGVYISTNGGASWTPTGGELQDRRGQRNPWAYALAVDPTDPSVVYAGSQRYYGDPQFQTFGRLQVKDGLWRSTDGGRTWQLLRQDVWVENIVVDPVRPGHVYFSEHSWSIWHSSDRGATWDLATKGLVAWSAHLYPYGMAMDESGTVLYMINCGMGMYRNLVKAPEAVR